MLIYLAVRKGEYLEVCVGNAGLSGPLRRWVFVLRLRHLVGLCNVLCSRGVFARAARPAPKAL